MTGLPGMGNVPAEFNREPPPRPTSPAIPDIGLNDMRPFMTENAFAVLTGLVNWAIHLQDIVEGNDMEWGDDKVNIAIAPFVGFGLPEMWEGAYKPKMFEGLMSIILRWHRKGRKWQKKNPLPWLILEYKACDLAHSAKGYQNSIAIEQILSDPEFKKKWKGSKE